LHPIESNIPLMCSKNTNLIGSLNPNSTLVTRGIYYNTKMGYVYTIEIFGNTDAYFRDHISTIVRKCAFFFKTTTFHDVVHINNFRIFANGVNRKWAFVVCSKKYLKCTK
jgi:hypothetical protein